MSVTWQADSLVAAHSDNGPRYKRNLLRQAVCEFRFPTLLELGGASPPAEFVKALRKDYPLMEVGNEVNLMSMGAGVANESNHVHTFRSSKQTSSVSLKQSSFFVETSVYSEFPQFRERVLRVVEAARRIIDSDFFTRVGLRYINVVDRDSDPLDGWINEDLVRPLTSGNFRGINEFSGRLHVSAPDGGCLLQHGIQLRPNVAGKSFPPTYTLDIDAYRTDIEYDQTDKALEALHIQAFDMFDWAIGPKARDFLTS